jgi:hypothetical protein
MTEPGGSERRPPPVPEADPPPVDSLSTDSLSTDSLSTDSLSTDSLSTDSLSTDSLSTDEVPPSAVPSPPAYDTSGRLEPTPAYDALAAEAPLTDAPVTDAPVTPPTVSPTAQPAPAQPAGDPRTQQLGADPLVGGRFEDDPLTAPLPPAQPPQELTPEADYAIAPNPTASDGPLAPVKAFAADNPAAFLGAALGAGWLLGKIMSRRGAN